MVINGYSGPNEDGERMHLHGACQVCGGEEGAVWRPREGGDLFRGGRHDEGDAGDGGTDLEAPDDDGTGLICGGESGAVGGPGKCGNGSGVAGEETDGLRVCPGEGDRDGAPDVDFSRDVCGGDPAAVRAEGA